LHELLAETGELDRILDGHGLEFHSVPAPVVEPRPPWRPSPPNWDQEAAERARLEREAAPAAELEPAESLEP
jgi:hypothetical protein